jgi:hypothetical protein
MNPIRRLRRLAALVAGLIAALVAFATPAFAATHPEPALVSNVAGSAYPAAPTDSGLAGCAALSGAYPAAAVGWSPIGAQFARSHWPDLRFSGLAYVDIATRLLTTHAYGGETVWFYQRLAAACAKHGRALPF